ncbi:MAG: hypothetical protein R6X08_03150 [Desulfosalsimonadaceae bacterium]
MKSRRHGCYAVITGDFIGFSPLSAQTRQQLFRLTEKGGRRLNEIFGRRSPEPVDIFRGDGWQMLFPDPGIAFRAGLFFRAFIRSHAAGRYTDVRMAVGVGPIDYAPQGRISAGDGEAFRRSGKLLETMISAREGTFRFAMDDSAAADAIDGMAFLAGAIAEGWTQNQSRALAGVLAGMSRKEIGALWPGKITPQAVSGHLKRAQWAALRFGVQNYEKSIRAIAPDAL